MTRRSRGADGCGRRRPSGGFDRRPEGGSTERVLPRKLIVLAIAGMALAGADIAAAAPELSVSDRLDDRRYGVAGERARAIGFEDGRFYANGWHITGEMGGVWSEPLKLVDGVWFGVGDEWVGPATEFRSGWGYAEFDLPSAAGLELERTDFVPEGRRAALFGLTMTNRGEDAGALVFRDQGRLPHPNAPEHDYAALVAADRDPVAAETDGSPNGYRGPQGTNVCSAQEMPSACDDGPFGRGAGGQLRYELTVPAGGPRPHWGAVAGS